MKIIISNSSKEPIYEQIATQIKNLILSNKLKEGEILPSIRNLAKELSISVITTKRAYDELEKEGFIETTPGRGSFVASQNKELLRERRLSIIEEKLTEVINDCKLMNLSLQEIMEMIKIIY
ncbi:GntR family transcriptional regulator [Clostridium tetani]|uniref:GntR family transcriptional regulator n=1 Tax=Clostridium tetani TaxID=1513 RepID=A0A4Q0UXG7_CLOTA|nr:GntR family transcriptional regulator [Clostridium tetani]RXI38426.1 GntR family transcriptional regulator [Clostridium tetani]RXI50396.1 GntR family transcriptional regulator [Clostridium tetani]RXM57829.1 GntR family transcriptional regulator [Clostridium tetani]RXM76576.1 GntR family transcriptional regulator [Clostridium tetani]RYU99074.1 GntR family transcriptional regulator [Clostridium tetani]